MGMESAAGIRLSHDLAIDYVGRKFGLVGWDARLDELRASGLAGRENFEPRDLVSARIPKLETR